MNLKKLSTMAFVAAMAMATTSCSNDDIVEGGGGQPGQNVVTGEKTWMSLNLKVGEVIGTRAVGENGGEGAATDGEKSIKTIDLYIFDETDKLEFAKTVEKGTGTTEGYDGSYLAPSTAVEVTSGKKTFCVILNKCGAITATPSTPTVPGTDLATFLKETAAMDSYDELMVGGLMIGNAEKTAKDLMMTGKAENITLHAGVSKEDIAGALNGTLEEQAANNVVTMNVNRAAAKLDLALTGANAEGIFTIGATAEPLATLGGITYKMNNIAKETYYFLQNVDGNQIYPTPHYGEKGSEAYWFDSNAFETVDGTTFYLTPNTHTQNNAKFGNTTYALVKGVYVPVEGKYIVTGYRNADDPTDGTKKKGFIYGDAGDLSAGQTSIFSYEYSVAFASTTASQDLQADLTTVQQEQLQALVAKRVADKYDAEKDIAVDGVKVLIGLDEYKTYVTEVEVEENGETKKKKQLTEKALNEWGDKQSLVYAYLVPVEVNDDFKEGHYTIVMERWSKKLGDTVASLDESFNLSPLSIAAYITAKEDPDGENSPVGLECYYRVNVFTKEYDKAHPMYYSVVRNYSYHVKVNSVSQIGENHSDNVDLPDGTNPDQPIEEATTFMQCSILINKWTASDMNVDLGK